VSLLSADAQTMLWNKPGGANRMAIASSGHVAVHNGKTARLYNSAVAELFALTMAASTFNDIAIDSASERVFVKVRTFHGVLLSLSETKGYRRSSHYPHTNSPVSLSGFAVEGAK
jgi:hypothetical protein